MTNKHNMGKFDMKIIFLIIFILFFSCNSDNIRIEYDKMKSQSFRFPDSLEIISNNKDTLPDNLINSKLKLVVYFKPQNCFSCIIGKLHQWNSLIEYGNIDNKPLKYLFVFDASNNNASDIFVAMKTYSFDYPVLVDTKGQFKNLNPHLPINSMLHTFLLDENNNVILVGNPLHNKKIEALFYATISKKIQEYNDIHND